MSQRPSTWLLNPEMVGEDVCTQFASLTEREFQALRGALTRYFDYAKFDVIESLEDESMPSRAFRDEFRSLHSAMGKLGMRMRSPLPAE